MAMKDLQSLSARYRVHAECVGVACLALLVFVTMGTAARRKLGPARADRAKAAEVEAEIVNFRAAFRQSSPNGNAANAALPDSIAVVVPRDGRVSLAERLAARAERVGLSDVRVRFAAPDTSAAPAKPTLFSATVAVADYAISVDCAGSFAAVLSLVNDLPPSVALQRITAVREKAGSHFRLTLAVFEAAQATQHG